jgi:hypothetical protein
MKTRIKTAMHSLWIVALLFVAQNAHAQSFEGRITHTFEIAMLGGEKIEAVANVKGEKVMLAADIGPMGSFKIYGQEAQKGFIVVTNNVGYEVGLQDNAQASAVSNAPMPQPTGKKATVNGYAAEEWAVDLGNGQTASLWFTSDIDKNTANAIRTAMKALESTQPNNDPNQRERQKMFEEKGLVLVRLSVLVDGVSQMTVELQKVEKAKIADSVFEIPAGVTVQKLDPAMIQGSAPQQGN